MSSERTGQESREGQAQKKVALVGFADSWKTAPFDDPTVEIWGLNELHKYVPRWDRWFELHDSETLGVTIRDLSEGEQKRHLQWLSMVHGKPIYMQPQFCDGRFPDAVPYPLEAMIARFGRYFTSTIGYMLALAIEEGADWIGLYGIDLASDIEYLGQRPNAEYFVGLARGMGKTVELAESSALLKGGHLYGYEKPIADNPLTDFVKTHLKQLAEKKDQTIAALNTIDGAMQAYDNVLKSAAFKERGVSVAPVPA